MRAPLRAELDALRAGLRLQPAATFLVAGVALCVYHYLPGDRALADRALRLGLAADAGYARCLGWNLSAWAPLVLLPLLARAAVARLAREPTPAWGWAPGDWRLGGAACALFAACALALSAYGAGQPEFQAAYPLCVEARGSPLRLAGYDLTFALYFVAWESFFRGYLLFGLERELGRWAAFVQMLPFAVIHFDKPFLEALSSVFGGVALGLLALRTRSFWYGALIHIVLAVGMDVLVTARVGFR